MTLRNKAISGIIWSGLERFSQQGIAFIVQLILARLLLPEQFGLVAMVSVFISISRVVVDAGFARAIIQKKEVTQEDLSTVFYFNVLVGILMFFVIWYSAPWIAKFYENPALTELLRYLGFGIIIASFGTVQQALLNKEMAFRRLFKISLPSTAVSGCIGVVLAVYGFGVWALIIQALAQKTLWTLSLWLCNPWRPKLLFRILSLREMFPYGSRLALSAALDQIFQNAYVLIIGKNFSVVDVGLFHRAKSFTQMPVLHFQVILSRVLFPLLSQIQDDKERSRNGVKKAIQISTLMVAPIMSLLAVLSPQLVLVLLGEKWLEVVPLMRLLCIAAIMYPIHSVNVNLLMAVGRSDLFLRLEIIKKGLIVANIVITSGIGLIAMVYGIIMTSFLSLALNTYYTKKIINYSLFDQMVDVLPIALISLMIFAVNFFILSQTELWVGMEMLIGVLVSCIIFRLLIVCFPRDFRAELASIIGKFKIRSGIIHLALALK